MTNSFVGDLVSPLQVLLYSPVGNRWNDSYNGGAMWYFPIWENISVDKLIMSTIRIEMGKGHTKMYK